MTVRQASARFNKLKSITECIQQKDDFYVLYLGASRNVFVSHLIPASTGTTPAVLPDASEVCGTMVEMLPAPSAVFTEDYFSRPKYPIKVLFNIAQFYGFDNVEDAFLAQLSLSNYEKAHKGILNQTRFAYVLGMDPGSTRPVIDKFKNARSILTHRQPGAPGAPAVPAKPDTAEPGSAASHASRLAVQSVSGPIPGLTGFDPATICAGPVPGMQQGPIGSQMIAEGPLRAEKLSGARTFGSPASAFPGAGVGP